MNLLSYLNMLVDINTWCKVIGLFENVITGSSSFYLTKCLSCIPYILLLLLTTLFLFLVLVIPPGGLN